jgi:hypothetical protein
MSTNPNPTKNRGEKMSGNKILAHSKMPAIITVSFAFGFTMVSLALIA